MIKGKEKAGLVVQSNELIEAYYDVDLTVSEHKIIRYVASKIRPNDIQFPDYSFEVKEFLDAAGVKGNNYHEQFEKIAEELSKRRIKVKSKEKTGWFPWFSAIVYDKGTVHISFNPLIRDMILKLQGSFTNYPFSAVSPLRSGHSLRLFELLKQYERIGQRTIEVDELKMMLGISAKYPEYANFKQRVLNKAQKELKAKTKLSFEYTEIKKGKKTTAIQFKINSDYKEEQMNLFDEPEKDSDFSKAATALLEARGIKVKKETVTEWEKFGEEMLKEVLEEIGEKKHKIKYYDKYISKILEKKAEKETESPRIGQKRPAAPQRRKLIRQEVVPDWLKKEHEEEEERLRGNQKAVSPEKEEELKNWLENYNSEDKMDEERKKIKEWIKEYKNT